MNRFFTIKLLVLVVVLSTVARNPVVVFSKTPGPPKESPTASPRSAIPLSDPSQLAHPNFRIFTSKDGLPQNSVRSIAIDQKGYLCVGTQDGAAYYNGSKWIAFQIKQRIPSRFVRTILPTADGSLWFGTDGGGLSRLKDGEWSVFDVQSGLPSNVVRVLLETTAQDGKKILWVGTDGGLLRFDNGVWVKFDTASGLPNNTIWSLLETHEGPGTHKLWIGTEKGLACLEEGETVVRGNGEKNLGSSVLSPQSSARWKWTTYDTTSGLPSNTVYSLLETSGNHGEGILWVGTDDGLGRFENGHWSVITKSSGLPNTNINSLLESISINGHRTLWAGTYGGGLARLDDDQWTVYDTTSGLPSDMVATMLETKTREGHRTLWVGTFTGGLIRLEYEKWQVFDARSGLPHNVVSSLLETRSQTGDPVFWFGLNSGGLARFEHGKWSFVTGKDGIPEKWISSLLETVAIDGTRTLWVGTYGGGLAFLQNGKWTCRDISSGLPNNRVTCLVQTKGMDGNPVVWIGTYGGGVVRFYNGQWNTITTDSGLVNNWVWSMLATTAPTGTQTLWVGTRAGGLARYEENPSSKFQVPSYSNSDSEDKNQKSETQNSKLKTQNFLEGRWTHFDISSGLPNNWVWSLHERISFNGNRTLWIGTGGGVTGLVLGPGPEKMFTVSETTNPALPNNVVYHILEDHNKRLYLCTNRGIARLTMLKDAPEGASQMSILTYSSEDGLPSDDSLINPVKYLVDHHGRLWAGTAGGMAIFDPSKEIGDQTAKPLYIERTLLLNKDTGAVTETALKDAGLAYHQNNLTFEFSLLNFFHESETVYRTQLRGFDKKPSEWTSEAKREYTNLPEGDYVFSVWGKTYTGVVSGPTTITFQVHPAPWRTWWFYALEGALLALLTYGFYASRIRTLRRRQEYRIKYLRQLLESIRLINSQFDLTTILQNIAEEGALLVNAEPGGIGLIEGDQVVFKKIWLRDHWEDGPLVFKLGEGVAGMVAATAQAVIVNDPKTSPLVVNQTMIDQYFVHGMMDVPIKTHQGKVLGVLDVRRRMGRAPFNDNDRQLIESLAHQVAVAIEKASLYVELETKNVELEEKNLLIIESMRELEKLYKKELEVTQSLQDLDRMKTNFIIVTSHELRTPLTVLKGYNDVLVNEFLGTLNEAQMKSVTTCQRMVDRMIVTFNKILEMLKINEGKATLHLESFDLCDMVRSVEDEWVYFAERRGQRLLLEGPETLSLTADREKVALALHNVIQNAIKFTHDDGEIRVQIIKEPQAAHIIVTDTGIGIDQVEMTRIFDQFYTNPDPSTHKSGNFEFSARGTGLGLAIVKNYVEAHGGKIWGESDGPGCGSRFHIVLPLVGQPVNENHPPPNKPELGEKTNQLAGS